MHAWLSVVGFVAFGVGVGLTFGVGPALMVCGGVAFLAGGLGSRRENRRP